MVWKRIFSVEIRRIRWPLEGGSMLSTAWQILPILDYGIWNKVWIIQLAHQYVDALQMRSQVPAQITMQWNSIVLFNSLLKCYKDLNLFLLILCSLRFDLSLSNQFYTLNARYDVYLHFRHEKELSDFRICIAVPFLWHVSCSEMPNHGNSCVFSGHQLIWNPFKRVTRSHLIHFECFSVVFNSTFTTNPMFFFLVNRMKIKETTLFRIIVQVIHFKKGFALFSYRH